MALTLIDISHLLVTRGKEQYGGEAVNQLEHALQCAHLAELAGETPQTVAAALLHDIGHLLAPDLGAADTAGRDGLHQYVALPFLRALLPPAVLEPVRLHVDAKRYLCTMEHGYWEALSPASKHSLDDTHPAGEHGPRGTGPGAARLAGAGRGCRRHAAGRP